MIVPGDIAGGRYVSNLDSLQVGSAPEAPPGPGGISDSFSIPGDIHRRRNAGDRHLYRHPALDAAE
jgi:hypothetical protein